MAGFGGERKLVRRVRFVTRRVSEGSVNSKNPSLTRRVRIKAQLQNLRFGLGSNRDLLDLRLELGIIRASLVVGYIYFIRLSYEKRHWWKKRVLKIDTSGSFPESEFG